jgi:hypothetical protein
MGAGDGMKTTSDGSALVLGEVDRDALEKLADGMAERASLRASRTQGRSRDPDQTKRARLERSQEILSDALEGVIASPVMRQALERSGYDVAGLRQAGAGGTWARDVAPAIKTLQSLVERDDERQRVQAVGEAARTMNAPGPRDRTPGGDDWLDALETRVRTSLGKSGTDQAEVAQRLISWAEEAMGGVSDPVAATARAVLVHHAFEDEIDGTGSDQKAELRASMRALMVAGSAGRYRREIEALAPEEPAPANHIEASDGTASAPAQRQMTNLAGIGQATLESETVPPGLRARLRGLLAGRGAEDALHENASGGEDDDLPEALRRRYAVHVSPDRKTIELFEAGAKSPAIILDARSITTTHDDGAVITDIVALARDRGWQSLKVSGTAGFKDAIWLEASKAGLVAHHDPSSAMRAAYAKWDRERPANQIQQGPPAAEMTPGANQRPREDLAQAFVEKTPEERLADPRLRNAQLELMIGIRTAEKELKKPIADMPEVAQALAAAIREQLASGRMFDAPFVKPSPQKLGAKQVTNPKIEADRIPPPRP